MAENSSVILIVDDDHGLCDVLVRLLRVNGFDAAACCDAPDALATALAYQPELIVLDEMMPIMTGLELLRRLRGDPLMAHVPVLFYSAVDSTEKRREAEMLGAREWLVKGDCSWTELLEHIRRISGKEKH